MTTTSVKFGGGAGVPAASLACVAPYRADCGTDALEAAHRRGAIFNSIFNSLLIRFSVRINSPCLCDQGLRGASIGWGR